MIFGAGAAPFTVNTPRQSQPRLLKTAYYSHLHPFSQVLNPMRAVVTRVGPFPPGMTPGGSPPQMAVPAAPVPGPTAGAFGRAPSPYRTMRTGLFPAGIRAIRAGVTGAPGFIKQNTPPGYAANVPGGSYAVG